jgi:hypothetical protein
MAPPWKLAHPVLHAPSVANMPVRERAFVAAPRPVAPELAAPDVRLERGVLPTAVGRVEVDARRHDLVDLVENLG